MAVPKGIRFVWEPLSIPQLDPTRASGRSPERAPVTPPLPRRRVLPILGKGGTIPIPLLRNHAQLFIPFAPLRPAQSQRIQSWLQPFDWLRLEGVLLATTNEERETLVYSPLARPARACHVIAFHRGAGRFLRAGLYGTGDVDVLSRACKQGQRTSRWKADRGGGHAHFPCLQPAPSSPPFEVFARRRNPRQVSLTRRRLARGGVAQFMTPPRREVWSW